MFSRGVRPLNLGTLHYIRVWAALTGVLLTIAFFIGLLFGHQPSPTLAMLVSAIGGFELFLFTQDIWLKRRRRHG